MRRTKAPSFWIGGITVADEMGGRHNLPEDPRAAAEVMAALRQRDAEARASQAARERQRDRAKQAREGRCVEGNAIVLRNALEYLEGNPEATPSEVARAIRWPREFSTKPRSREQHLRRLLRRHGRLLP